MGEKWGGGGAVQLFFPELGRPQTEKYVTKGNSNFLILSYSSSNQSCRVPQNISPFLYMQFTIGE